MLNIKVISSCISYGMCLFQRVCPFFFLSFVFLGPHWRHMEVLRPGVELELLAYDRATAMPDLSRVCNPTPQLTATPDP